MAISCLSGHYHGYVNQGLNLKSTLVKSVLVGNEWLVACAFILH